ncbi:MAG: cryptochrome/photolyase family protein [Planctomycetota bacterium]
MMPTRGNSRASGAEFGPVRRLHVAFGDQLDPNSPALRRLDRERDAVLVMEVGEESTHVPVHRQRVALFLAAMRHFVAELRAGGVRVHHVAVDDPENQHTFDREFWRAVEGLRPAEVQVIHPGEWRVLEHVETWQREFDGPFELLEDDHFLLSIAEFRQWAAGRRELVMEHFYRMMRRRLGVLIEADGTPSGGQWNFDSSNREPFRGSKESLPERLAFEPDEITSEVLDLVARRFPANPGGLASFQWPVTRAQALVALENFVEHRLPKFGGYQDAMVSGQPWMFHSLLSPALNLKLLDPREVVQRAVAAYQGGHAPIESVEGFVRQVIGWREFIRGIYWSEGRDYCDRNALEQHGRLPEFYWTGDTDMRCLRECVGEVLANGFGHHIQRLMVTGNYALMSGVAPREISDWYLGMYVDAIDWVTLPNTLGMVMHADGGRVGTKPYAASGKYISRMSDYCRGCRYDPVQRVGPKACPLTTLYWDFLDRNRERFRGNRRMGFAMKNLARISEHEWVQIREQARRLREPDGAAG